MAQIYSDVIRTLGHRLQKLDPGVPFFVLTSSEYLDIFGAKIMQQLHEDGIGVKVVGRDGLSMPWNLRDMRQLRRILVELRKWPPAEDAWLKWLIFDPQLWQGFDLVAYMDSDMLPLEGIQEIFSLPDDVGFASSNEGHRRLCEHADGLNAGLMVARPNGTVLSMISSRLEEGWLLQNATPFLDTENFDQTWFDLFFRHHSTRRICPTPQKRLQGHQRGWRSFPPLGRELLQPHLALPQAYNFFVDSYHAHELHREWKETGAIPAELLWGLGAGSAYPGVRMLHWPGHFEEPWWRCLPRARSIADQFWWDAHQEACETGACYLAC